ncbi:MAG: NYN domain-containing protein [candidate division KSB1 bacterium]|nr:NYN domain-containing protein [candidate division KSB1 bacterium]
MTMPRIVVDGYNVIHASQELAALLAHELEAARQALLHRLAAYLNTHKVEIVVVFDGAEVHPSSTGTALLPRLRLVFSHPPESGDAVIEKLLRAEAHPRSVTLVTADKRLAAVARERGASVLSPRRFLQLVTKSRQADDLVDNKFNGEMSEAELAEWLALFGEKTERSRRA